MFGLRSASLAAAIIGHSANSSEKSLVLGGHWTYSFLGIRTQTFVTSAVLAVAMLGSAYSASAETLVEDPLHAFCFGGTTCATNGTTLQTSDSTPQFGFNISPGPNTGQYFVDILVPNTSVANASLSFDIWGTQFGTSNSTTVLQASAFTSTLFSTTPWTSGDLSTYLGLSPAASPNNNLGGIPPQSGTGFYVYQVDLGQNKIEAHPGTSAGPQLNISALVADSYLVAFLLSSKTEKIKKGDPFPGGGTCDTNGGCDVVVPDWIATANSSTVLYHPNTPPGGGGGVVPLPAAVWLFASGLAGLGLIGIRRRRRTPSSF